MITYLNPFSLFVNLRMKGLTWTVHRPRQRQGTIEFYLEFNYNCTPRVLCQVYDFHPNEPPTLSSMMKFMFPPLEHRNVDCWLTTVTSQLTVNAFQHRFDDDQTHHFNTHSACSVSTLLTLNLMNEKNKMQHLPLEKSTLPFVDVNQTGCICLLLIHIHIPIYILLVHLCVATTPFTNNCHTIRDEN